MYYNIFTTEHILWLRYQNGLHVHKIVLKYIFMPLEHMMPLYFVYKQQPSCAHVNATGKPLSSDLFLIKVITYASRNITGKKRYKMCSQPHKTVDMK